MTLDREEVLGRFASRALDWDQHARVEKVRAEFTNAAAKVLELTRAGRDQSVALTHLEEAATWAVKAIAREQG